eukprot:scaffold136426_cov17-Prasinocladus_malaysianus.AAC.1
MSDNECNRQHPRQSVAIPFYVPSEHPCVAVANTFIKPPNDAVLCLSELRICHDMQSYRFGKRTKFTICPMLFKPAR